MPGKPLDQILREQQGIRSAATLVLHTWNQRLDHHPHVHALVPGGGLSLDGSRWNKTRHKKHRRRKEPYLTDNIELGKRFRKVFIQGLMRLHRTGELKLDGQWSQLKETAALESWLETVAPAGWNVFIERPPTEDAKPENVLKYLARYLSGGPISDRRLIWHDGKTVRFWARSREKPPAGERPEQVAEKLPAVEFTRRWALHILPKGFVKARSYGGFSNKHRAAYLQRCCQLLDIQPAGEAEAELPSETEQESLLVELERPWLACPHCQQAMHCIVATEPPQLVGHHEQHSPSALVSTVLMNILPAPNFRLDDAQSCPAAHSSQPQPITPIGIVTVDKTDLESSTRHKLKSFRSSGNLSLRQFYA